MADDKKKVEEEKTEDTEQKGDEKVSKIKKFMPWIIMAGIILVISGSGLGLGKIAAGIRNSRITNPKPATGTSDPKKAAGSQDENIKTWEKSLDPVVANLNVPGSRRFVRAEIIIVFQTHNDEEEKDTTTLFDEKKSMLLNSLIIYLTDLSEEDCLGEKNKRRTCRSKGCFIR